MNQIRWDDGGAYERSMGRWSRLVGDVFLDWLDPPTGRRWVDVGCGNGAFTELVMQRCAPAEVQALDPSEGQLAFARTRPGAAGAMFRQGDALALPFDEDSFDIAVMALVIFFVPEPARGVAEMARVARPGGEVVAYAWNFTAGGFPYEPIQAELRAMGFKPPLPPHVAVATPAGLSRLWTDAGLQDVTTQEITVHRAWPDFDAFWNDTTVSGALATLIGSLPPEQLATLRAQVAARLQRPDGRIAYDSLATAIRGRVPG
ncbi:class I SAM-dependent methyltransferase [Falsiroseomonas oryziterrae]|uniref:class I SAM-dependent methyltransferase n=1 Tax=Falsiroseomonas oryziterrae TaxID=2911368 RepID=UPI001F014A08|nr:methyltransferase domain-containing protein [Roseomonas sp. NPKOSM-4]